MSDALTVAAFLIAGALIIGALVGLAVALIWAMDRRSTR